MSSQLPVEICLAILGFLTDPLDVYAIRRTSRFFYAQAGAILYPNLELTLGPHGIPSASRHTRFFSGLASSPSHAASIRRLTIQFQDVGAEEDISYTIEPVIALTNIVHYEASIIGDSSWFSIEIPIPYQTTALRTLIIRNFLVPKDICSFLYQQPLIETLVLDLPGQGIQRMRRGRLEEYRNLLPRLKTLACDAATAAILLPGRDILAFRCTDLSIMSVLPRSDSVVSLYVDATSGVNHEAYMKSFPNVRKLWSSALHVQNGSINTLQGIEYLGIVIDGGVVVMSKGWVSRLFDSFPKLTVIEVVPFKPTSSHSKPVRYRRGEQGVINFNVPRWDAWMYV